MTKYSVTKKYEIVEETAGTGKIRETPETTKYTPARQDDREIYDEIKLLGEKWPNIQTAYSQEQVKLCRFYKKI